MMPFAPIMSLYNVVAQDERVHWSWLGLEPVKLATQPFSRLAFLLS